MRLKRTYIIGLLGILFAVACINRPGIADSLDSSAFYRQQKSLPPIVDQRETSTGGVIVSLPGGDPLQEALNKIEVTPSDLIRPLSYEDGYLMLARQPVVDLVAESPYVLHSWADETSQRLQKGARSSLQELVSVAIQTLGGVPRGFQHTAESLGPNQGVAAAYQYLCRKYASIAEGEILQQIRNAGFNQSFDVRLGRLIGAIAEAAAITNKAFSGLSPEELSFLMSRPERFFYPDGRQFNFLTAPTHVQVEITSIARRINFGELYDALRYICQEIDVFIGYGQDRLSADASSNLFFADKKEHRGLILNLPSPVGNIVILGPDDNDFHGEAALLIDLGGNDRYLGSAASGPMNRGRLSIFIDIAGNEVYTAPREAFAQGAGITSIGILADLSGDDRYIAGDMAQGCGIFGIGVLADFSGNDSYEMGLMGQGFGVYGTGILLDQKGNDHYILGGMGQGAASTMGFGGLCDCSGDDDYRAEREPLKGKLAPDEWSHAQGAGISIRSPDWRRHFSLYGGVGFLSDGGGNDLYICSGGNCMGAGYFMSIGALVDDSGDDRYIPKNGNGMGFAAHLASAILIDRGGNDSYFAKNDSGGVGADRSVGMLVDYQGDDLYGPQLTAFPLSSLLDLDEVSEPKPVFTVTSEAELAVTSYASSSRPKGLGFLLDYGGNDRYFAQLGGRSASLGKVVPPADPHNWGHALLLDLSGKDYYYSVGQKDNFYLNYLDHGLCYDADFKGPIYLRENGRRRQELENQPGPIPPEISVSRAFRKEANWLASPDNFVRFTSIGRIINMKPEIVHDLIEALLSSTDKEFNLSAMEALNHFIVRKQINEKRGGHFEDLLKARDPAVRIYAARTLGWWNVKKAVSTLRATMRDPEPTVRVQALWAIGRLGTRADLPLLQETALAETVPACKRSATQAFTAILAADSTDKDKEEKKAVMDALLLWLNDSDPIVRCDAAEGLRYTGPGTKTTQALKRGLNDVDTYVKRTSAKSLAFLGRKEGIPVLIETLKFPSIDTAENYDQELVKEIAFFCGTDFPEEKRYDYRIWADWWKKDGNAVNLKENLAIMHKIESAFQQEDEQKGMRILDQLIRTHPDNIVIRNRYKRYCRDWITFRLLAQESIKRDTVERCLRLQQKMVDLAPEDPQSWATLSGFYARLTNIDDAMASIKTALQIDPDNLEYRKMLNNYRTLKKTAEGH